MAEGWARLLVGVETRSWGGDAGEMEVGMLGTGGWAVALQPAEVRMPAAQQPADVGWLLRSSWQQWGWQLLSSRQMWDGCCVAAGGDGDGSLAGSRGRNGCCAAAGRGGANSELLLIAQQGWDGELL